MQAKSVTEMSDAAIRRNLTRLRAVARPSNANLNRRVALLLELERRTGRWESY